MTKNIYRKSTRRVRKAFLNFPVISLIVPMKDDAKYIGLCLQSLLDQRYPADRLEIIVVDGQSRDGSREIAQEFADRDRRIRLLENPRIITASGANIGLQAARGDMLGVVSSHCTLDAGYVSAIVKLLDDRPDLACAGGGMRTIGSGYLGKAIALVLSSPFGVGGSKFRTANRTQLVDTIAFGLYPRAVFEEVGLFDERLVRNEDNDFHWRLRKTGGKLMLTTDVHSYYYAPETLHKFSRQAFNNGLWNIRLLRLVGKGLAGRHLVPLLFVLTLIAFTGISLVNRPQPLMALGLAYFTASVIASLAAGIKGGRHFALILPILFLLIHLSYGFGSAVGLLEALPGLGIAGRFEISRPAAIKRLGKR